MADEEEYDLEAEGLYGMSYDSFWSIDQRIREFGGFHVPTRSGVTKAQTATFFAVLFLSFIVNALVISPVFSILHIPKPFFLTVLLILGVPVLCSWRVTRPMPHKKTIPGTVLSFITYHLDDPVHRRGVPVPTPTRPQDQFVMHYQRQWELCEEYVDAVPVEGDWTDAETERLRSWDTGHVDLQAWMDTRALTHHAEEVAAKETVTGGGVVAHDRRGQLASVSDV